MDIKIMEKYFENRDFIISELKSNPIDSYIDLIKIVAKCILGDKYSEKNIKETNFGDYQGTHFFIFSSNSYQPEAEETYITHNYYGSCSECDALLNIIQYQENNFNEEQIENLLYLCCQLFQHTSCLGFLDVENKKEEELKKLGLGIK